MPKRGAYVSQTGNSVGWELERVLQLYSGGEAGEQFLELMRLKRLTIASFGTATGTFSSGDSIRKVDISDVLYGWFDGVRTIYVSESLSNEGAAVTLFHEYQHFGGADEISARIAAEDFAIAMGWPETRPGYRGQDGSPDIGAIVKDVTRKNPYGELIGVQFPGGTRIRLPGSPPIKPVIIPPTP